MSYNVVFVVLDACRAHNLSCYGYDKPTSPNMDSIAREGVMFENAFSTINVTDPSLTTIFTGYYPTSHGMTKQAEMEFVPNPKIKFLSEILKANGYTTMAVDWLSRWHERGYDWYGYQPKLGKDVISLKSWAINIRNLIKFLLPYDKIPTPIISALRKVYNIILPSWYPRWYDAKKTTDIAINLIKENKNKKFFLFIHYWDTHTPYNASSHIWKKFYKKKYGKSVEDVLGSLLLEDDITFYKKWIGNTKDIDEVIAMYDGAISYVDGEIGRIYEYLDKIDILDDTIFVITSDHGECLTEHGIFFDHRGALYDEVLRVPLIIRSSTFSQKVKVKGFVQHVDILPTLLELLNIRYEADFDGKSLIPTITDNKNIRDYIFAVMENEAKYAVRNEKYKYILQNADSKILKRFKNQQGVSEIEELYDLQERNESENLIEIYPEVAKNMQDILIKVLKDTKSKYKTMVKKKTNGKSNENIKERLKALGYFE